MPIKNLSLSEGDLSHSFQLAHSKCGCRTSENWIARVRPLPGPAGRVARQESLGKSDRGNHIATYTWSATFPFTDVCRLFRTWSRGLPSRPKRHKTLLSQPSPP